MARKRAKIVIAFGDCHIPNHSESALATINKVVELLQPSDCIMLGDILDCSAFSTHAPSPGDAPGNYENDLMTCGKLIDKLAKNAAHVAFLCGNHEYRIARFAARAAEGAAAYNLLAPEIVIPRGRDKRKFTLIPYGVSSDNRYSFYDITPNLAAIHGWSCGVTAARKHLQQSQGRSVLFAHTHKISVEAIQHIWGSGIVQAINPGCTCKLNPTYTAGRIVDWSHGMAIFYISNRNPTDFTAYVVPITDGRCILPDGREVKA